MVCAERVVQASEQPNNSRFLTLNSHNQASAWTAPHHPRIIFKRLFGAGGAVHISNVLASVANSTACVQHKNQPNGLHPSPVGNGIRAIFHFRFALRPWYSSILRLAAFMYSAVKIWIRLMPCRTTSGRGIIFFRSSHAQSLTPH